MITVFNRKELLIAYDMQQQSALRTLLADHGIACRVKVVNLTSPSPISAGTRARTGTFGVAQAHSYEYKIYVKKSDFEKAAALMQQRG